MKKWELLSNASGYIIPGVEDYGISVIEAISCGTPVLAYAAGGVLENVEEGVNGCFFYDEDGFDTALKNFKNTEWDHIKISKSLVNYNSKESFKSEIKKIFQKNDII